MAGDDPVLAALADVVERLERIESLLQQRSALDDDFATLLDLIVKHVGTRPFSTWQVLENAKLREGDEFRLAIRACLGAENENNAMKLGHLLRKLEGLGAVIRVGDENGVAKWQVRRDLRA